MHSSSHVQVHPGAFGAKADPAMASKLRLAPVNVWHGVAAAKLQGIAVC